METSEQLEVSSTGPADDDGPRPFDKEDWREWNHIKKIKKRCTEEQKKKETEKASKIEEE